MPDAVLEASSETVRPRPPGIWTFIALDCTSFGIFFLVFMAERLTQAPLFDQSARLLDVRLGFLNTCILITSSWMVALANIAGRRGDLRNCGRLLLIGAAIASLFAVIKIFEYAQKLRAGVTITTNEFYTFYFALTGVHLLHYFIGLIILTVIAFRARTAGDGGHVQERFRAWLDGGALYWHMVDLLWIFLFTMLYLLGAR